LAPSGANSASKESIQSGGIWPNNGDLPLVESNCHRLAPGCVKYCFTPDNGPHMAEEAMCVACLCPNIDYFAPWKGFL
jgi:hypothetical protein